MTGLRTLLLSLPFLVLQGRDIPRLDGFLAATEPIVAQRRSAVVTVDGLKVGRGVWVQEGPRAHLAFRDPLGRPRVVLRVAHGAVGVEMVGEREVVAPDAAVALEAMFASTPSVWAQAIWGRLPSEWREHGAVSVSEGATHTGVVGPGLDALLDAGGRVDRAASAGWIAHRTPEEPTGTERVVLRHAQRSLQVELVLGPPAPVDGPLPDHVFRIGSEQRSPTVSVEHIAELSRRASLDRVMGRGEPESGL